MLWCKPNLHLKARDRDNEGPKFNYDGHNFLEEAFIRGAQATGVARNSKANVPKDFLHWIVDDTLMAYQEIALLHRMCLNVPVVAVTGSAGKTTTREIIRGTLSPLGLIHSSSNNNNNDVGVPQTLLNANTNHSAIVGEMGMRGAKSVTSQHR